MENDGSEPVFFGIKKHVSPDCSLTGRQLRSL